MWDYHILSYVFYHDKFKNTYTHIHTYIRTYIHAYTYTPVLEITAGHWPFSDQFQHLADQNRILVSQFYCTFSIGWQSITYKISYLQKTPDQFLTFISTTALIHHYVSFSHSHGTYPVYWHTPNSSHPLNSGHTILYWLTAKSNILIIIFNNICGWFSTLLNSSCSI